MTVNNVLFFYVDEFSLVANSETSGHAVRRLCNIACSVYSQLASICLASAAMTLRVAVAIAFDAVRLGFQWVPYEHTSECPQCYCGKTRQVPYEPSLSERKSKS